MTALLSAAGGQFILSLRRLITPCRFICQNRHYHTAHLLIIVIISVQVTLNCAEPPNGSCRVRQIGKDCHYWPQRQVHKTPVVELFALAWAESITFCSRLTGNAQLPLCCSGLSSGLSPNLSGHGPSRLVPPSTFRVFHVRSYSRVCETPGRATLTQSLFPFYLRLLLWKCELDQTDVLCLSLGVC